MSDASRTRPSLFQLIGDLPRLVTDLVKGEIELVKAEMTAKVKALGIGAGLIAGAAVFLLWFVAILLVAAVLGLSAVLPGWLAALIVAAVLLVIAVVLGLVGYLRIKRGLPPAPTETIDSVKRDIVALKGIGDPRS